MLYINMLSWYFCTFCSNILIYIIYSDRRLADHFGGKLHLGYMQIREKLAELQVSYLSRIFQTCVILSYFKTDCLIVQHVFHFRFRN